MNRAKRAKHVLTYGLVPSVACLSLLAACSGGASPPTARGVTSVDPGAGNAPVASGSATVSWTPPTSNVDGSPLATLAGYRILYGKDAGNLTQSIDVANPGLTRYVVDNLDASTWYFGVQAYTSDGQESALSNVASKTVN